MTWFKWLLIFVFQPVLQVYEHRKSICFQFGFVACHSSILFRISEIHKQAWTIWLEQYFEYTSTDSYRDTKHTQFCGAGNTHWEVSYSEDKCGRIRHRWGNRYEIRDLRPYCDAELVAVSQRWLRGLLRRENFEFSWRVFFVVFPATPSASLWGCAVIHISICFLPKQFSVGSSASWNLDWPEFTQSSKFAYSSRQRNN